MVHLAPYKTLCTLLQHICVRAGASRPQHGIAVQSISFVVQDILLHERMFGHCGSYSAVLEHFSSDIVSFLMKLSQNHKVQ